GAYTQLGYCSLFGMGLAPNVDTTQKLFAKAVSLKHQNAQIFMDYCSKNGISLDNGAAVMKQIATAAKSGDATAQFLMGEFYSDGCGVKMDEKAMMAYYAQAAKQNYAPALSALSWAYEMGMLVKENRETAIQLAIRAAEQGDADALTYLNTVGQVEFEEETQPAN
ncbi:MAG: hypothetical protein Q4C70_13555, partial [Planctomycetia bacterium]|nr:hypothetical protein [Planctomycetia bacterium]